MSKNDIDGKDVLQALGIMGCIYVVIYGIPIALAVWLIVWIVNKFAG